MNSPCCSCQGRYELAEPGVLLHASLPPLAAAHQLSTPQAGLSAAEVAQLAGQQLANNAGMLAAAGAVWQVGGGLCRA